jgi:DNA-binding transcriptional MerR regulator
MYIGNLSKLTNVSRKTIRFYEEMGLLPTPKRKGKYRFYEPKDVEIIQTIKCAQSLGFKLNELNGVLQPQPNVERINILIEQKRQYLQNQIDEAKAKDKLLEELQHNFASLMSCGCARK